MRILSSLILSIACSFTVCTSAQALTFNLQPSIDLTVGKSLYFEKDCGPTFGCITKNNSSGLIYDNDFLFLSTKYKERHYDAGTKAYFHSEELFFYENYLKFNLPSMINKYKIKSVKLQLTSINKEGVGLKNFLYYVNNNDWNSSTSWNDFLYDFFIASEDGDKAEDKLVWDFSSKFIEKIFKNEDKKTLSFALTQEFDKSLATGSIFERNLISREFLISREGALTYSMAPPELIIETSPAPEPSTLFLALIGLCGGFGIKKRNKNN